MSGAARTSEKAPVDTAQRLLFFLLKRFGKAIREYHLIDAGDRIGVAVSGGKDSLALLRLLLAWRSVQNEDVEIVAIHVTTPGAAGSAEQDTLLTAHFTALGVRHDSVALEMAGGETWPLSCERCAWNRRKTLFRAAQRLGLNKVAFGHHFDDAAVTALLNLFYQARLESLNPCRSFFSGAITLIRPMILIKEKDIAGFARHAGYPIGHLCCPQSGNTERARMAAFLRDLERENRHVKSNIWHAARRAESAERG